jgi:hypothetical protein
MIEKRGIVDEENTRPESPDSPKELVSHATKRASDAAFIALVDKHNKVATTESADVSNRG